MFEKILVVTDFSDHAHRMLECILGISGIEEIVLLHVVGAPGTVMGRETVEAFAWDAARSDYDKELQYLKSLADGVAVTPELIMSSDVPGAILEAAERNHADLVATSAYGMGMKTGLLTGNISTSVLCRFSRINVLVMRHNVIETLAGKKFEKFCPMLFSRILCPTDFSANSLQAVAHAAAVGGVGEIILLHVVANEEIPGGVQEAVRRAEVRIGALRESLAAKGVSSRTVVKMGESAGLITGTAEEEDVSAIWINSSGKGCFQDFLLGSTVNEIVMNANRPVIVIKAFD